MASNDATGVLHATIFSDETIKCKIVSEGSLKGTVGMPEMIEVPVIPSNYGLITWNGSVLTVS